MTRIISICSGKGGAGKTMLTANLGAALAERGKDVTIIDGNLTTPNLGFHLGIPLYPTTLHDVLKGKTRITNAIYKHESGVKIIPAGIGIDDLKGIDARDLSNSLLDLLGSTDIILIDGAAGLGREALSAIEGSDEMIVVTIPELPSVTDALKAVKLAQQLGTKVAGVVINRIGGKKHELTRDEIRNMLDDVDLIAEIPEDEAVQEAISRRMPVIHHKPGSRAARELKKLAAFLVGEEYENQESWYRRIFGFLARK